MKVAIVGSGVAGVTCARALHTLGHEVEIFEASSRDSPTRPRQMEGSVHSFENVPEITPDRRMKILEVHSPDNVILLKGNIGYYRNLGFYNICSI